MEIGCWFSSWKFWKDDIFVFAKKILCWLSKNNKRLKSFNFFTSTKHQEMLTNNCCVALIGKTKHWWWSCYWELAVNRRQIPCWMFINICTWSLHTNQKRHKVILKQSLMGLYSEYSFSLISCYTKDKKPSLSNYSPIARRKIVGFIPFPKVLVLYEM